jgi:hypothetical protein
MEPSCEYQTRSTGPVATEGNAIPTAALPMCRHSSWLWAWLDTPANPQTNSSTTHLDVAL